MNLFNRFKKPSEINFDKARELMVERQIVGSGVKDKRVIEAMRKVPRHMFVNDEYKDSSYGDYPLPIGEDQTISQPYMVASMTECLALKGDEKVLEIGAGSGYQAAILAELAKEVFTVERIEKLALKAKKVLQELGYQNIKVKIGDGTMGWEEFSPYDGVIVTAGAPDVPEPLFQQLKESGRLVIPIGDKLVQTLTIVRKVKGKPEETRLFGCMFVPLVGKYGWPQ
jgi:protein-L-isoaspartate(D-aspartate) O-methyltransferase